MTFLQEIARFFFEEFVVAALTEDAVDASSMSFGMLHYNMLMNM